MTSRAVQITYTLMGKNNVNHTTNDPIICFSTTENLDSDPDPKSGSPAGSGSEIRIQKKANP